MTEDILRVLVLYSMKHLAEEGIMHSIRFTLINEHHDGVLRLEKGYKPDARVCFTTGAVAKGDDHLVQHYLHFAANMDEMRSWLLDESNADGIIRSLIELSARVDQGFD